MANKILPNTKPTLAEATAMANAIAAPNGANGEPVQMLEVPEQVTVIAEAVTNALTIYAVASDATKGTKKAHDDQVTSEFNAREELLVTLAQVSIECECTKDHIETAVGPAVTAWCAASNTKRTPETVNQFVTECKRAMHPAAREHVSDVLTASTPAWKAERDEQKAWRVACDEMPKGEAKPEQPAQPLQNAFGKRYHMVIGSKGMLAAYVDQANNPKTAKVPTPEDATDFDTLASQHLGVQRNDSKRAARAMVKLAETLEALCVTFPHEDLRTMLKFAQELAADKDLHEVLEAARIKALRAATRANGLTRAPKNANGASAPKKPSAPVVSVEDTNSAIDELAG
jgi:hypothetical protein